ncbi:MAG: class I SAM-dependent methyltransferase [Myxococcaceae bacterium]
MASDFENRLRKIQQPRFAWAAKEKTNAFRLYDLDIPEWPVAVDWYAGFVHVMEYPSRKQQRQGTGAMQQEVTRAISAVLQVPAEKIFFKAHERRAWGEGQYERATRGASTLVTVEEHGLKFECNLSDYLDAGLFLDHRPMRARVRKEASGLRFLNLFAYTGSFTVHARAGGASETTTVDLSNTYCDWAERNLALNGFSVGGVHQVVRHDVLAWVEAAKGRYELIVCDPPSFSTSKKMGRRWEVQRDHRHLVEQLLGLLAPGGQLYFSTNFLGFSLDPKLPKAEVVNSQAADFRRTVQQTWRFRG